ncbi:long-chain-fatty-acid--CoA ligase 4-like [Penaeus japonicus]|uniref:long-chain-fatty-acid--CoA ligase 4-like n=1 Tax=Penaeus japonicus TaxID=27405 RepID=UPI001C70F2CE|nr:long-chain-fatty-acid--CoA ligase 4-like [Penaeus japonicus]XP_042891101.1 long-chain-fatty-acid--CoA ligase 4-like [Penaeus japonicus]
MVVERKGVRNEAGYWVKGDGGHKHGFRLLEELQAASATTLPAILEYAANKHGDAPCMGTRQILARERVVENDKKLEKLKLGVYSFLTYREVQDQVVKFGAGLASIGTGDTGRIAMFGETRAEWFMAAIGCLRQRLSLVTVYTNLADDNIVSSLNETEVSLIITSYDLLARTVKILPKCPAIKHVIVMEDQLEGMGTVPEDLKDVAVVAFKDVIKAGESVEASSDMPAGDDLAIIMYTSGSGGRPKGVELTHNNIFFAITGYAIQADIGLGDRYLAFLPLAHVMELATEISLVAMNVTIVYSSPLTLTSVSPKIMKGTLGDAQVAKPTCINAVPLVLDRIIKGVTRVIEDQGFLKAKIFNAALKFKHTVPPSVSKLFDTLIFNKVKEHLGGELRMLVVGGAPLSPETQSKIRAMFGCTVQVGYGATETAASITSTDTDDPRTGQCGPPNHGVLVTLRDWEEGGYRTTDEPHPRGEILVGGPTVSRGYFRLPKETEESFVEMDGERWFQTGDIGEFDDTGVLRIIDRKKDLVKLRTGEYISLGAIEMKLKTHPVLESIFVWAFPGAENCIAVAVPMQDRLRKIADNLDPKGEAKGDTSFANLCKDKAVVATVLKELQNHGKKQGLGRWDLPVGLHLSPEPWTPESGLVTAALKIRRKPLVTHFQSEIDALYGNLGKEE